MDLPTVLRLPRLDQSVAGFVLLHVSSAGRRALDLKLIGTDGESVFSVSLKHNQTSSLREKQFSGDQKTFDNVLSSILIGGKKDEAAQDVEAVARIEDGTLLVLIQKRIEGINQRFAKIKLPETSEVEIELFDWCGLTVQSRNKTNFEVEELQSKLQEKDAEAQRLKEELADLVQRKIDHENSLIEKFSLLLNEKKLKIRDQQRLLASATVDPAKLQAVERSRDARSRSPGPSRIGKRKAGAAIKDNDSEDDSEDGFEKMDLDVEQATIDSEDNPSRTPDPESTADEASEDGEPPSSPPVRRAVSEAKGRVSTSSSKADAVDTAPPPKRDLPFGKKRAASPPKAAAPEGSETESDGDDEL